METGLFTSEQDQLNTKIFTEKENYGLYNLLNQRVFSNCQSLNSRESESLHSYVNDYKNLYAACHEPANGENPKELSEFLSLKCTDERAVEILNKAFATQFPELMEVEQVQNWISSFQYLKNDYKNISGDYVSQVQQEQAQH